VDNVKNDFLPEMEPDGEYYSCSNKQRHGDNCKRIPEGHQARDFGFTRLYKTKDGREVGCITVTKWDVGISMVKQRMADLQIMPPMTFETDIKVGVILDILRDAGIASDDEQNERFQIRLYTALKSTLDELEPQAKAAKQQMLRQQIMAPPGIIPPPKKMH